MTEELSYWKAEAERLRREVIGLRAAHSILAHREWFAVSGEAGRGDEEGRFTLFYCSRDGTAPCCTLGPKDVVLVGRYTGDPERQAILDALTLER